jgi:hypothetical protein
VCPSIPPPKSNLNACTNLYKTWLCISWHLSPSHQSVCLYVYPLSLLGNGSVNTYPQQRIHTTTEGFLVRHFLFGPCFVKGESVGLSVHPPLSSLGNKSLQTFRLQRRIVGSVFYAVRAVSKERWRFLLPRTSCFYLHGYVLEGIPHIFFSLLRNNFGDETQREGERGRKRRESGGWRNERHSILSGKETKNIVFF